jgi:hypothetical protein
MDQKKINQERARKYAGSSSFVDKAEPSKAPRQDEDGRDFTGSSDSDQTREYNSADTQGVSNRPAKVEHAFPDSDESRTDPAVQETEEAAPRQQGGPRGRV